jgi:hypothetical protein
VLQSQGCDPRPHGGFDYGFAASFAVRPKSVLVLLALFDESR